MKTLRPLLVSLSLFGLLMMGVNGQETEKKVHLKVIKGGETTVDTVFSASDLKDEDLHKMISELAGVDFQMMHGGDMYMHMSHNEGHNYAYVTVDDSEEGEGQVKKKIIIKKGGEGEETKDIYLYSTDKDIKEGEHVFVMKGDSGSWTKKDGNVMIVTSGEEKNVWVTKEGEEGGTTKIIVKHAGEGEEGSEEMIFMKEGKDIHGKGEHYIIKEIEKDHEGYVKIAKVKKGEGDSEEVTVTVITDNEMHMSHGKKDDTDIVVTDVKGGTVIVTKNIEVSKSIGEDGELIEITVVIDGGEKEKMKEKSKETKQKKDKDRNKK